MKDDGDRDREFMDDVDRILQGREDLVREPGDADARSRLDFARRMVRLRPKPSRAFRENLKAELVHRLAEEERKTPPGTRSFFMWEISRRKMWQGTVAALIVVLVMAVILLVVMVTKSCGLPVPA